MKPTNTAIQLTEDYTFDKRKVLILVTYCENFPRFPVITKRTPVFVILNNTKLKYCNRHHLVCTDTIIVFVVPGNIIAMEKM